MRAFKLLIALGVMSTLLVTAPNVAAASSYSSTPAPGNTLVFPDTLVGATSNPSLQVTNTGDSPLTVSNPQFSGTNASDFSSLLFAGVTVQPQQTTNMNSYFRCRPSATGLRTETLTLTTNDPAQATV